MRRNIILIVLGVTAVAILVAAVIVATSITEGAFKLMEIVTTTKR
jgi:hypothetical protein